MPLPTPDFASTSILNLRQPDLATAARIAEAINASIGDGTAAVLDPGAIALELSGDAATNRAGTLTQIGGLTVTPDRRAQVIIDGRDGTVVVGGGLQVGEAVVSHGALTIAIGSTVEDGTPGSVRVPAGTSVQDVAIALHAVAATPSAIAAIFRSLREVGAIHGEVVVR